MSDRVNDIEDRLSGTVQATAVTSLSTQTGITTPGNSVEIEDSGIYMVTVFASVPSSTSGVFAIIFRRNGSAFRMAVTLMAGMGGQQFSGTRFFVLNAGDVIEPAVIQTSGTALTVAGVQMQYVRIR